MDFGSNAILGSQEVRIGWQRVPITSGQLVVHIVGMQEVA